MIDEIRIDCRGVRIKGFPTLTVESDHGTTHFVREADYRETDPFHGCLFVDRDAHHRDALRYPKSRRFAALMESPIDVCHRDFDRLEQTYQVIFTDQESLISKGEPYKKLLYGTNWLGVRTEADTRAIRNEHPAKDRLVSFMGSILHDSRGAYDLRRTVAEHCVAADEIDAFGRGILEIDTKREALARYRFSITMENVASDLYFSEKLVDCILMETVPIYFGCPSIGEVFDPKGFFLFSNLEELTEILQGLSVDQYESMRPHLLENKRRLIDNGWHSHQARFDELALTIAPLLNGLDPIQTANSSLKRAAISASRMASSVTSRFKQVLQ